MSKIILLDENTINKIAAGEVVERPASVVKELVENAIDAASTAITVEIKEGGLSLIRITDNGSGIDPSDINNAFLRHSTSKIRKMEDLMTVSSLGFRGEALASIAAVSQVEMLTKTFDNLTGIRYVIEGGLERAFEEVGCPEGTTFIVKNIFYNTPVRRKFLKTPATEAAYVAELMNRLALGNPHISFKFINNGQIKLHTSGNNSLKDCIYTVFGKDIAKNLIEVNVTNHDFHLKGYIGKPLISRANRTYENYYINGRYIKSKVIQKAIEDAYKSKLTLHQYPFTVFNIEVFSELIDVNVHPTKMEIRFNNEISVYEFVYSALSKALSEQDLIPEVSFDVKKSMIKAEYQPSLPEPFEVKRRESTKITDVIQDEKIQDDISLVRESSEANRLYFNHTTAERNKSDDIIKTENEVKTVKSSTGIPEKLIQGEQIDYKESLFTDADAMKEHKVIGQLFNTYWIVEFKDKYYIIDQHAAHERVLYEKIINALKSMRVNSQQLLTPLIVNLSMKEKDRLNKHMILFKELGFEIEDFGGDAVAIRSVPYIFEKPIHPNDFIMILDRLEDEYKEEKYGIILDEIASMACKAAVKAHDKMTSLEYQKLIDELLLLENPFNCPHGRPTIIAMTRYELEKKFKRIQ